MITYQPQSGFSLVETLVAISILLIVIVGPMTISVTASRSTSFASEQVVAFFLAQEGAEIAQKARDDLLIDAFAGNSVDAWGSFTDTSSGGVYRQCFDPDDGCGLELSTDAVGTITTPIDCGDGTKCALYLSGDSDTRARYTHESAGNQPTTYQRQILFENIDANQIRVISRVFWRTGSIRDVQSVEVETYLYNVYGI